ncbi:MAG TPA: cupin domain-containing protein [bacterium]|nr:cupin domain-containing protein [bacterium]HOL48518.1 cupin domain-containing protein [bacterium]HPQ19055.1 cupin domain-containing protein [bacterium]
MAKVKITHPTESEVKKMNFEDWGEWSCEVSEFPWQYSDRETCYILDGEVTVKTDEGDYSFKKGDLVVFEKGLKCTWVVKKPVRKYYKFG